MSASFFLDATMKHGVAKLHDISESMFPTKSSSVPLARLKCLTVNTLYCNSLEACQRHAATFRVENHTKLEFCNTPLKSLTIGLLRRDALEGAVAELPGISDPVFPTKSSRVPSIRFKRLTVSMLYRNALEAYQRHAATFRA